jgi:anti-anti-sigma regulatory factor
MSTITVNQTPGALLLKLDSPLPRSCEGWETFASGLHHACLGRTVRDGLVLDLRGIPRLTSAEIGGIARCLATVVKAAEVPCRLRIVTDSPQVRRVFQMCEDTELGVFATSEQAVASFAPVP